MRLNKREITKLAEDMNAMDDVLAQDEHVDPGFRSENIGSYLYLSSMLLNMDGDVAAKVQVRREELRAEYNARTYTAVAEGVKTNEEAQDAVAFLRRNGIKSIVEVNPWKKEDSIFPTLHNPYLVKVQDADKMDSWILFEQNAHVVNVLTGETVQERGW